MMNSPIDRSTTVTRTYWFAGLSIGFALAGFFDGILLHQILQWHSLLSSLNGEVFADLRFRMLTDGLFHAAMYLVGALGLFMLWRARAQFAASGSGRRFASALLIGFGAWHLIDAVLNHWILGLHHIREDANWLAWDLLFFSLGLACVGVGIFVHFRRPPDGGGSRLNSVTASILSVAVIGAGSFAATPRTNNQSVTVVFRTDVSSAQIVAAMRSVDGRMIWNNSDGDIWTFSVKSSADAWKLYGHGALFVSGSLFGIGCFSATPASMI